MIHSKHSSPKDETFGEMERWVHKLISKAAQRWPNLNVPEIKSEAYQAYCKAYNTYTPNKGAFSTWVGVKIRSALLDYVRAQIAKAKKAEALFSQIVPNDIEFDPPAPKKSSFKINEWLQGLSPDAKKVAKLVLFDPPIDVKLLIKQFGEDRKDAYRRAIKTFLTGIGWSVVRINETFTEIKESL